MMTTPTRMTTARLVILLTLTFAFVLATTNSAKAATGDNSAATYWHPASQISQSLIQNSESAAQTSGAQVQAAATTQSSKHKIQTIPYWTSSFDYQGQTYPYSMVGTNPAKGSGISVVPTLLIPVKLTLSDGSVWNGESKVRDVLNSPLFRFNQYESGYTQYGDAIQRAEFWHYVSTKSPFYHVFLTPPVVLPTLALNVPADMGAPRTRATGVVFGGVDIDWLDSQFMNYMQQYHISPRTFPIFLAANVLGTEANGTLCCIGGYHNAVANADNSAIQTYAYATYNDPGFSAKNPKVFTNTDALSHEISEWYNDPFVNNEVPFWSVANQPQYGCNNALESGDPLVGIGFDIGNYHLQDEAFFSWFARQSPSIGIDGKYTYLGTFDSVAQSCTA